MTIGFCRNVNNIFNFKFIMKFIKNVQKQSCQNEIALGTMLGRYIPKHLLLSKKTAQAHKGAILKTYLNNIILVGSKNWFIGLQN